ncbi:MAG: hypothetical protein RL404_2312 [Pseudomonadota bacterium]|jgi:uncharacterized Zn-finger protein
MIEAPETVTVHSSRVKCDGATQLRADGSTNAAALGHPRVWLEIDDRGYADCPYCDKRFVLEGGH